jgi:hypothetical protein
MARRDFDAAADEMLGNRPVFTLGGREWTCRPAIKFNAIADIADEDGLEFLRGFFDRAIIKSQREAWNAFLDADIDDDDTVPVTGKQLRDVFDWLIEEYTGKSPNSSTDSSPSPEPSGPPSKVVSLDPGTGVRLVG